MLPENLQQYLEIRERIRTIAKSSCERTKIEDLVELAFRSNSRDITISKRTFNELMGTKNRQSIKDFLFKYEKLGIIQEREGTRSSYELRLTSKLLGGDEVLPAQEVELKIVFGNPEKDETEEMGAKQDKTILKYNEEISDLLQEVTDIDTARSLPSSEALSKAFRDRVEQLKRKIRNFENRHHASLRLELMNLNSILNILNLNSAPKEEETRGRKAELPMNPNHFVKHFYSHLTKKMQTPMVCNAWPAEVKTAKEIIRRFHEMKKDEPFIRSFIEWVIENHTDKVNMFYLKFKISDYMQTLDDKTQWDARYAAFLSQGGKPQTEQDLTCYFVKLYEEQYGRYQPQSTYARDMGDMCNIFKYLGSHVDKVAIFIRWAVEVAMPKLKQIPARPAALLKFISEFDQQFDQLLREADDSDGLDEETKKAVKMSQLLIKRSHVRRDVSFEGAEREKLEKTLEKTRFDHLDAEAQKIVMDNPQAFTVTNNVIGLVPMTEEQS